MNKRFSRCLALLMVLLPIGCGADDSVFVQAHLLREALAKGDLAYIRSLDKDGELAVGDNISYLFETSWIRKVDPKKVSIRDIVKAANVSTYVSRQEFKGRRIYYIYWVNAQPSGDAVLSRGEWLRTVAACALEKTRDGSWRFFEHLCFAETGGPFE